ncbi:tetratricopeptide repeat protein [Phormidium sp. LEGE 05292]|uniref:CHAT domain-containing protein n=1 Tax=[Phormidium] sp. LEGE 05292 TaxID=767427 RepID=UPI00187E7477|nr:tetratricopeptide repeat protein [Phormidium sp. LEGE 05292]MBE9227183.1 tetratricopeptide repeat protein [Phormidium sp. LEGE 05292]
MKKAFTSSFLTVTLFVVLPLATNHLVQAQSPIKQQQTEVNQLFQQAVEQYQTGKFSTALQTYQQVLQLQKKLNNQAGIAETLDNIGEVYTSLSEYKQALDVLQQALTIRQKLNDKAGIGETLNNLGYVYRLLGEYPKALELHQQSLAIAKQIKKPAIEGEALHNIAAVYAAQGDYNQALELYQQALIIRQQVGDKRDEGRTLNNIGGVYFNVGEYQKAINYYQQALAIRRTLKDRAGVGRIVSNLALVYRQLGEYEKALEFYQQALPILQEIGDKASVGSTLNGMGIIYENQGKYEQALVTYQQSLQIAQEIGDRPGIGNTLDNIGGILYSQGKYPQALKSYQEALAIRQQIGDKSGLGNSLNNLGGVYFNLGQYPEALKFLQQALTIRREIGDKAGEGKNLDAIGNIYEQLKQYNQALEYYRQALAISQQISDKAAEGNTLENIGSIYANLGEYSQAEKLLFQSLSMRQTIGDKAGEGRNLNSIANVKFKLKQYPQSLENLQQALVIFQELGDKSGESITLSNIGYLLEQQNQPTLAIVFYKKAINIIEAIRQDLKVLSIEQQQSFTNTITDTYRNLANLLLKQDRIIEAQQVLDLLKVQELNDYLRNVRGNEQTAKGVDLLSQEQQITEKYNQAIKLGKELVQLRNIPDNQRTPQQQQRIAELEKIQQQIRTDFNDFIRSPEIVTLSQELSRTTKNQNLNLPNLNRLQRSLQQLPQSTAILYPLILDDRIELVLVTAYSPPIRRSIPVKRTQLYQEIVKFRGALQNPEIDAKVSARQLYNWLIKPIENQLVQADTKTIFYAPDGQLRYIPLSALFDGKQWLVQRFQINYITAATLSNFNIVPKPNPRILAAAFSQGNYTVKAGNRQLVFAGLPFAALEIKNLAETLPNTTKLLDNDFSPATVIPTLNEYNIVHLATHAAFLTGSPEDSFILFGNGEFVTLRDVETWSLSGVDLVVLSACETAVGGKLGNGEEILGFGYQMQIAGALASISSLWAVSDGGTQALMDGFYLALKTGNVNKAEALRRSQIALITSNAQVGGEQRGLVIQQATRSYLPSQVIQRLNHPYYWAPFILIGNN